MKVKRKKSALRPFLLFAFHLPTFSLSTFYLSSCAHRDTASLEPGEAFFVEEMKPLLEERCLPCHNGRVLEGRLNLESRETAFQAGPAGPFIVPGNPKKSRIYTFILLSEGQPRAMPPTGHGLSEVEITLLEDWIARGAPWPSGESGRLKPAARGAEPRSARATIDRPFKPQPACPAGQPSIA